MDQTWFLVLAFLFNCALALEIKPLQTCERRYKKRGCFKESVSKPYLKKLFVYARVEKGQLIWDKFGQSLHSLACRCEAKARDMNYTHFSIRFYGECWVGTGVSNLLDKPEYRSDTCVNSNYQKCDPAQAGECAGVALSDYIYEIGPVDGGLSPWVRRSECSRPCGPGKTLWKRTCTNPKPSMGGKPCSGPTVELRSCSIKPCATIELARGKRTRQSSTTDGAISARAVDGNNNTNFKSNSCTQTKKERYPWWMVDLEQEVEVVKLAITNRGDCCGDRLNGFQVWVGKSDDIYDKRNEPCARDQRAKTAETKIVTCNGHPKGRYLFIALPTTGTLTLCEVKVYAITSQPSFSGFSVKSKQIVREMAKGKPTSQSSTGFGGVSSRAVDGKNNSYFSDRSCSHTFKDNNPWWMVDLKQKVEVKKVVVTTRGDCCGARLSGADIWLSNNNDPLNKNKSLLCGNIHTIETGETKTVNCQSNTIGRYLFIGLPKKEYLALCEVKVYASPDFSLPTLPGPRPPPMVHEMARGKPTKQSSTGFGANSSRAVDGSVDSDFNENSCSHTLKDKNPWWMVDLQQIVEVKQVVVTNRGDCCGERLNGFQVWLTNSNNPHDQDNVTCAKDQQMLRRRAKIVKCQENAIGRYLFIGLPKTEFLALCEVKVYAKALPLLILPTGSPAPITKAEITRRQPIVREMARGKPTDQSSTDESGLSSRAVDGNDSSDYSKKSCSHTNKEKNPWWMVDLQKTVTVVNVSVTNRGDCCSERLNGFSIWLTHNKDPYDNTQAVCAYDQNIKTAGTKTVICTENASGRYLFIGLPKTEYLTLCEVKVYAYPLPLVQSG